MFSVLPSHLMLPVEGRGPQFWSPEFGISVLLTVSGEFWRRIGLALSDRWKQFKKGGGWGEAGRKHPIIANLTQENRGLRSLEEGEQRPEVPGGRGTEV